MYSTPLMVLGAAGAATKVILTTCGRQDRVRHLAQHAGMNQVKHHGMTDDAGGQRRELVAPGAPLRLQPARQPRLPGRQRGCPAMFISWCMPGA